MPALLRGTSTFLFVFNLVLDERCVRSPIVSSDFGITGGCHFLQTACFGREHFIVLPIFFDNNTNDSWSSYVVAIRPPGTQTSTTTASKTTMTTSEEQKERRKTDSNITTTNIWTTDTHIHIQRGDDLRWGLPSVARLGAKNMGRNKVHQRG